MRDKSDVFPDRLIKLAAVAKAISHPARLSILETLGRKNACVCGEVVQLLPLAQSTVSQHLQTLRDAELIDGRIEGPSTCYCLNRDTIAIFAQEMAEYLSDLATVPDDSLEPQLC